jgi:hypothetical protein
VREAFGKIQKIGKLGTEDPGKPGGPKTIAEGGWKELRSARIKAELSKLTGANILGQPRKAEWFRKVSKLLNALCPPGKKELRCSLIQADSSGLSFYTLFNVFIGDKEIRKDPIRLRNFTPDGTPFNLSLPLGSPILFRFYKNLDELQIGSYGTASIDNIWGPIAAIHDPRAAAPTEDRKYWTAVIDITGPGAGDRSFTVGLQFAPELPPPDEWPAAEEWPEALKESPRAKR